MDEGFGFWKRAVDFIAQVADVNFDGVGQHDGIFIPDVVDDHIFGNNLALVVDKVFKQGEFFVRKFDRGLCPLDFVIRGVHGEVVDFDDCPRVDTRTP